MSYIASHYWLPTEIKFTIKGLCNLTKKGCWHVYKHILFYKRFSSTDLVYFETKSKSTPCNDVNYKKTRAVDMLPCSKAVQYYDTDFRLKGYTGLFAYHGVCKPFFLAGRDN